jgi:uncharacterized membrane protein
LIVLIAGPSILLVPIDVLRLFVGVLLLIFGMQWLRKAILRATGFKELHDEEKIFEAELQSARTAEKTKTFSNLDKYSFTLSFKTVLLEGFEVIFIVLTFGALKNSLGIATMAAFFSLALVAGVAFAIRKPLTKVPENTLKFVVGTMATTFGIFWTTEGLKIAWVYADATLLLLAALVLTASFGCILWLRGKKPASKKQTEASNPPKSKLFLAVRSSLDFVYELLIGDEWITGVSLWILVALGSAVSISSDAWYLVPLYFVVILPVGLRRQVSFQNQ